MILPEDGRKLVELARSAIAAHLDGTIVDVVPFRRFDTKQGVFVTLTSDGNLRGCIGFPAPILPLFEAVIEAARSAAFEDPRFPPLTKQELAKIKVEVSVLTIPEELDREKEEIPGMITIGKDGLIIKGLSTGLLLPQVASEWGFSQVRFLEAVSEKAGLPKDAWKDKRNRISVFQAQIFNEQP